jgi:hypothetical protein
MYYFTKLSFIVYGLISASVPTAVVVTSDGPFTQVSSYLCLDLDYD